MNTDPLSAPQPSLSELENEMIALFVDFVRWLGAPKSLGAIYGLLFISESPLSFEQIATRLQMSNGSVSQGLRLLKELGAAKVAYVPGERRDLFVAETQLRHLVTSFLKQHVERQLLSGEGRLGQLIDRAVLNEDARSIPTLLQERIGLLRRWQEHARNSLPLVLAMLKG